MSCSMDNMQAGERMQVYIVIWEAGQVNRREDVSE